MSEPADDGNANFAAEGDARRRHRRWFVNFNTTVTLGGEPIDCAVRDLSPGGARVELLQEATVFPGHRLTLELPGYGSVPAQAQHNTDGRLGLMFLHDEDGERAVAGYLIASKQSHRPPNREVTLDVTLRASGVEMPAVLHDVSRLGARAVLDETRHITLFQDVTLEVPGFGTVAASVQRLEGRELNLSFVEELDVVTGAVADDSS